LLNLVSSSAHNKYDAHENTTIDKRNKSSTPQHPEYDTELLEKSFAKLPYMQVFTISHRRLQDEAFRLNKLAVQNLIIGIIFCALGLFLLIYTIFTGNPFRSHSPTSESVDFWYSVGSRVGISLFLQLVGTFFLRLYVSCQNDYKHNKNEISNIECKVLSLAACAYYEKYELMKPIIESLAKTERNFILKKGERSVSVSEIESLGDPMATIQKLGHANPSKGT